MFGLEILERWSFELREDGAPWCPSYPNSVGEFLTPLELILLMVAISEASKPAACLSPGFRTFKKASIRLSHIQIYPDILNLKLMTGEHWMFLVYSG